MTYKAILDNDDSAILASLVVIQTSLDLIDDTVYSDGVGTPDKGILMMGSDGTNPQAISVNPDGELKVNLETADIEIGAVEIKNDDSDDRVKVKLGNTAAVADMAMVVADANVKADTTKIVTAVEIMDDWDESDRAAVNIIPGQVGVSANSGAVDALTQRMILATDDPAVTLLGTMDTSNTAIKNAVEIMDDWDESDRAKVNPIVGQAGIAAGAGAVGVTVPRTTLASDDPAVTALQIIDDWDESDRAKVNPIAGQAGIAANSGAADALTPRVILATDDPAVAVLEDVHNTSDSSLDASIVNQVAAENSYETAIDGTLDDDPTSITSTPIFVGDCAKVGFMFRADIDSTGNNVAISCTVQGGPENDDLVDLDIIMDSNGEDAPQSSISIGSLDVGTDGVVTAFAYLPVGFNVQYITLKMDGGATVDADDTAVVDAYVFKKKG